MISADQLLAHAVGDYVLQSHWMATEKTKRSEAAVAHVLCYALPFIFLLQPSRQALAVIVGTHFLIDRYRLARYVCWFKNWLAPYGRSGNLDWKACAATGYPPETPPWLATWLLIIVDNIMHVLINGLALTYL
jgi:hypothetical protein